MRSDETTLPHERNVSENRIYFAGWSLKSNRSQNSKKVAEHLNGRESTLNLGVCQPASRGGPRKDRLEFSIQE